MADIPAFQDNKCLTDSLEVPEGASGASDADANSAFSSKFHCSDCKVGFSTLAKLKYHRLTTHGKWQQGFECSTCQKKLASLSNLRRHNATHHPKGNRAGQALTKPNFVCPTCRYAAKDNLHLTVHMRKHTGVRPFECGNCKFSFYKKSDLTRHSRGCHGIKYSCSKCKHAFHFKKQWQEHTMWSKTCGVIDREAARDIEEAAPNDAPPLPPSTANSSRYMSEKPTMFRLNVSKDQSVVGVNCENLIDEAQFKKRKRRARCGLCEACQRMQNCDACQNCERRNATNGDRGRGRKMCEKRRCIHLVEQYDVVVEEGYNLVEIGGEHTGAELSLAEHPGHDLAPPEAIVIIP